MVRLRILKRWKIKSNMPRNTYTQETAPKKAMDCRVFFLNEQHELLLVKSPHKEHWAPPGGVIEVHESPRQAAIREVLEETGLTIERVQLLCLDYKGTGSHGADSVVWIFYGGVLTSTMQKNLHVDGEEIVETKFVDAETAKTLCTERMAKRITHCMKAITSNSIIYLEDGRIPA